MESFSLIGRGSFIEETQPSTSLRPSRFSSIQEWMSRTIWAGRPLRLPVEFASTLRGVASRRSGGRRSRSRGPRAIGISRPVSRRQSSVSSCKRDRDVVAAADVVNPPVPASRRWQLQHDQVEEIVDVQDVAHLLAAAAEADVTARAGRRHAAPPRASRPPGRPCPSARGPRGPRNG